MNDDLIVKLQDENVLKVNLTGDVTRIDINNIHVDTTANWNAQPEFVGLAGHLYIYSDYETIGGVNVGAIKVGDGNAYLLDIPFLTSNNTRLNEHIADTDVHIQDGERMFWNNKVTCFMSAGDSETVVFTKKSEEEYNNG